MKTYFIQPPLPDRFQQFVDAESHEEAFNFYMAFYGKYGSWQELGTIKGVYKVFEISSTDKAGLRAWSTFPIKFYGGGAI